MHLLPLNDGTMTNVSDSAAEERQIARENAVTPSIRSHDLTAAFDHCGASALFA